MRFDMRRIDHLHLGRSPTPGQFAKQVLPQPSTRPAHKAVINGCRRAIFGRAIAPAASALQNMHDPADDPAIVYPLDAAHIPRQIRPNSSPLLVAQPKQILAHDPDPFPKTNQDRILRAQKLMSFDPSHAGSRHSQRRAVTRRSSARRPGEPGLPEVRFGPCRWPAVLQLGSKAQTTRQRQTQEAALRTGASTARKLGPHAGS